MTRIGLMMTFFLLLSAASAGSQVVQDSMKPDAGVIQLAPVVVAAPVPFITRGGASALAVRPDSLRLGAGLTIERLVRELPFMQVRSNARGEGYFALRGSSFDARAVAVLVDGLPISLGFDHRADLAMLPATGASSITVVRGIPALLYGPNVLGGVVEMALAAGAGDRTGVALNTGYDHTGGYAVSGRVNGALAAGAGTVLMRAGGGYREADGFPLPDGVREPEPFGDHDLRLNSHRMQRDGFLSVRYGSPGGAWLSLTGLGYSAARGTPAELETNNPRFWSYPTQRRALGSVSLGSGSQGAPWGGRYRLEGSFGYDVGRTVLNSYTDRSYSVMSDQETNDDRNLTGRVLASQSIGSSGELSGALTYATVRRDERVGTSALDYEQHLYSGAIETGWRARLGEGTTLRLHGGIAYDAAKTPATANKPEVLPMEKWGARVGFTTMTAGNRVLLHGGIGQRARFPSLRELYSGALRMFEPNPDLRAEVLTASEVGSTVQLSDRVSVQTVLFHHRIEDAIVRTTTAARKVQRVNRDETRSTGLELLAMTTISAVTMSIDLTAQTVEVRDPTIDQAYRAEYQPKFAGGVRVRTPLPLRTNLDVSARTVGAQYCIANSGSYTRLERSERADVQLSRAWSLRGAGFSALDAGVAVDNVANTTIYDQCGLPQPGRLLRFRLTLR